MSTPYIDAILKEWDSDSEIDRQRLDNSAIEVSKLHAKYVRMYAYNNKKLREKEHALEDLRKMKRLHFDGKLTKKEIEDRGWKHDPLDGKKVMKSEIREWVDADTDVQAMRMLVGEYSSAKEILKEILGQINWRSNNLRLILDARKFEAGF